MANTKLVEEITRVMNQLPRFLVSSYLKIGKIKLVSRSEMNMRYKDALGLLDIPSKQIYIRDDLEIDYVEEVIFHEMGHYLDFQIEALCGNLASDSDEFQELYQYGRKKYFYEVHYHLLSDSKEFFAYIASKYFANMYLEDCFEEYLEDILEIFREEVKP